MRAHAPKAATFCLAAIALMWPSSARSADQYFGPETVAPTMTAVTFPAIGPSGVALTAIEIDTPPGRVGLDVPLSLTYSSARIQPTWVGPGWDIVVPQVRVVTRHGVQYNGQGLRKDTYELAEGEAARELIEVCESPDCRTVYYRLKIDDGSFFRLKRADAGNWLMWDKSGLIKTFGGTPASEQRSLTDPASVFSWMLTRVEDSRGNYISYTYTKPSPESMPFLEDVRYAGGVGLDPNNRIHFVREPLAKPWTTYQARFKSTLGQRVGAIETYTNAVEQKEVLFSYYALTYSADDVLESVQRLDAEGGSLPASSFTYTTLGNTVPKQVPAPGKALLQPGPVIHLNAIRLVGDFNGDGRSEIAYAGAGAHAWTLYSLADDAFVAETWPLVDKLGHEVAAYDPDRIGNEMEYLYVGDFNGDGRTDIARLAEWNGIYLFLSRGNGFDVTWVSTDPFVVLKNGGTKTNGETWGTFAFPVVGDFDGDGCDDIATFMSYTTGDEQAIVFMSRPANGTFVFAPVISNLVTKPNQVHLADLDGDGRTDILYNAFGQSATWNTLSWSGGAFLQGHRVGPDNSNWLFPADINGDGLTDFRGLKCADGVNTWTDWISTGTSYESGHTWAEQAPSGTCTHKFHLGDFNGDRRIDMVPILDWTRDPVSGDFDGNGATDVAELQYSGEVRLQLSGGLGGKVAGLLEEVSNGSGGKTAFSYGTSAGGQNRSLPFVLPVVKAVSRKNESGDVVQTESYAYRGGYFDPKEREFLGFREMDQISPDGIVKTTTTTQGGDLRGLPESIYVRLLGTVQPWMRTVFAWTTTGIDYPKFVLPESRVEFIGVSVQPVIGDSRTTRYWHDRTNGNLLGIDSYLYDYETYYPAATVEYEYEEFGSAWRLTRTWTSDHLYKKLRETRRHYLPTGELEWEERWLDGGVNDKTKYTYYPSGNVKTVQVGDQVLVDSDHGHTTSFSYDSSWSYASTIALPSTSDPVSGSSVVHVTSRILSPEHREECVVDENEHRHCNRWDSLGRPVERVTYEGNPSWPYADATIVADEVIEHFAPQGAPGSMRTRTLEKLGEPPVYVDEWTFFDAIGRVERTLQPRENVDKLGAFEATRHLYDMQGRPAGTDGPFRSGPDRTSQPPADNPYPWTRVTYDFLSQRTEKNFGETGGASQVGATVAKTTTYRVPFQLETVDYDGRTTTQVLNERGEAREVWETADDGSLRKTKYSYNAAGDLLSISLPGDPPANEITFVPDTLGRITKLVDPDLGTWERWFDSFGNLERELDPVGRAAGRLWSKFYSYDELDRPRVRTTRDGNVLSYTYDKATNGRGRLATVESSDEGGSVRRRTVNRYDALGRARSETRVLRGLPQGFTTGTEYDLAGRMSSLAYPGTSGHQVVYEYYPGTNYLKSVKDQLGAPYANFSAYGLGGRIGTIVFGNDKVWTRHYQDPSSVATTSIRTWRPGFTNVLNLGFGLSGEGNLTSTEDYGRTGTTGGVTRFDYAYDSVGRLSREALTNAPGTFLSRGVIAFKPHATLPHALGAVTIAGVDLTNEYDVNGNTKRSYDVTDPLSPATRAFSFNSDDMPSSITWQRSAQSTTATFLYEGRDRVLKTGGTGKDIAYVSPLLELVGGNPVQFVFANGLRVAMIDATSGTFFFHKDQIGNTVAVTDAAGEIAWTGAYTPFGLLREETTPKLTSDRVRYMFTDHEYDAETRLYYFGARYYDPGIGRFVSPDPTIPRLTDPQSLNRYSYARNCPTSRTDPDGAADYPATDPRVIAVLAQNTTFRDVLVNSNNSSPLAFQEALLSSSLRGRSGSAWNAFKGLMAEAVFIRQVNGAGGINGIAAPFPKAWIPWPGMGRHAPDVVVFGTLHQVGGRLTDVVVSEWGHTGSVWFAGGLQAGVYEVKNAVGASKIRDGMNQTVLNATYISAAAKLGGLNVPAVLVVDYEAWDKLSDRTRVEVFSTLQRVNAYVYPMPGLSFQADQALLQLTIGF